MAQRVVVVGAGLAGSILAAELAQYCDVTVIELSRKNSSLALPLADVNWPAGLDPHVGSGPGGTTALWNNGLIELEDDDYDAWPIRKEELQPYLAKAYPILAGMAREKVIDCYEELCNLHVSRGIPRDMLGNGLYYPQQRRNLWQSLQVSNRTIQLITGRASLDQLHGPVGIAQITRKVALWGFLPFISLIAVLSVSIGLINLFPIPLLDGGHLLYYACEAVLGRPLGERVQDVGFRLGLVLVLGLMLLATWNDIARLNLF